MLAQDLAFSHDEDPLRVDPQADRAVRERGRHAVAVALEVHEARRGHALGLLDKAVKGSPQSHQARNLAGMRIGHAARNDAMHDLAPLGDALPFEPGIQAIEIREVRQWLPQAPAGILHVLLDLPLLPP